MIRLNWWTRKLGTRVKSNLRKIEIYLSNIITEQYNHVTFPG